VTNATIPNIDINKAAADVNKAIKDGAYIAIGLGVLGFQRAQVQRVELTKQLEAQLGQLSSLPTTLNAQAETARTQIGEQITALTKSVEEALSAVQTQVAKVVPGDLSNLDLPKFPDVTRQWNDAGKSLEEQLETARTQLAELAKVIDEAFQPVRHQLDEQVDKFEQRLPASARNLVQSVRAAATAPEQVLRSAVGLD
jgi:methyl-accepting chemotaxis protein